MPTETLDPDDTKKRLAVPADAIVIADTGKPFVMFSRRNLRTAVADAINEIILTRKK